MPNKRVFRTLSQRIFKLLILMLKTERTLTENQSKWRKTIHNHYKMFEKDRVVSESKAWYTCAGFSSHMTDFYIVFPFIHALWWDSLDLLLTHTLYHKTGINFLWIIIDGSQYHFFGTAYHHDILSDLQVLSTTNVTCMLPS